VAGEQIDAAIAGVLVVDDHPLYCEALAMALQQAFRDAAIRTTTTLGGALEAIAAGFAPDLVMLDLRLPDVRGLSGFVELRMAVPDAPILVISGLATREVAQAVMAAGAAGFVPKDASVRVLHQALAAMRDGRRFAPEEYGVETDGPPLPPCATGIAQRIATLTPQQARIMRLICAGKPNKQIAYELSLAEATVKAHITALLRRLGVHNRTQAAVLVEGAQLYDGLHVAEEFADTDLRSAAR
jgi:DNA-binding NarL/FixJ family response regulator